MKHSRTKNSFWEKKKKNVVNGASLFNHSYLITLMAYLCSLWASKPQIKYFMFDWSIYRQFVLNRAWKHDSLQIYLFVHVSSTCSTGELKTRFETWITRNDVNGESLFHLSYLINLMAYICSQTTADYKSSILSLIRRSTDYLAK
jgi:hypothetical protein